MKQCTLMRTCNWSIGHKIKEDLSYFLKNSYPFIVGSHYLKKKNSLTTHWIVYLIISSTWYTSMEIHLFKQIRLYIESVYILCYCKSILGSNEPFKNKSRSFSNTSDHHHVRRYLMLKSIVSYPCHSCIHIHGVCVLLELS